MSYSYQLYSSRNWPLAETIPMLTETGYGAVEGYGALLAEDAKIAEVKALLDQSGLAMPTAHMGLDLIEGDPSRAIRIAGDLGITSVYCPFLMPADRPTDAAGWRAFGERLQAAGAPLRDAGLDFGWHNHDFEFEPLPDGTSPQAHIFEGGPDLSWEMDVAWIVRGGGHPSTWIAQYGDRITAVHVKDIAADGDKADEDGWADVGHGTMDWQSLMASLRATPAKHFIMEHDNPSDHVRFARQSLASVSKY